MDFTLNDHGEMSGFNFRGTVLCGDEDKEKMEYMGELDLRSADDHAGQNQMVDVQKQLTHEWYWEKPMLEENAPSW